MNFGIKLNNGDFDTEWNGWYSTQDDNVVINAFESVSNQPDDNDLEEDPGLVGAVYYAIYEFEHDGNAKIREIDGGLFMYHEDAVFRDFCKFIEEIHGYSILSKIFGELEDALENAEEI